MNGAFMITPSYFGKVMALAVQLGYANGKKEGDGMAEELQEVARRHPEWVTFLGNTKADAAMMTGNLREKGVKVLNLNEEAKRKKNEKDI